MRVLKDTCNQDIGAVKALPWYVETTQGRTYCKTKKIAYKLMLKMRWSEFKSKIKNLWQ